MNFILRLLTWWNSQTLGTQLFTWRNGVKVGEDAEGNIYYQQPRRQPPLGHLQRRGRGQPHQPGMARLAAPHLGRAADREAAAPQGLGEAARRQPDRDGARPTRRRARSGGAAGAAAGLRGLDPRVSVWREHPVELPPAPGVVAVAAAFLVYAAEFAGGREHRRLRADRELPVGRGRHGRHRRAPGGRRVGTVTDLSAQHRDLPRRRGLRHRRARCGSPTTARPRWRSEGLLGGTFIDLQPGGSPFNLEAGAEIVDTQSAVSLVTLLLRFVTGSEE